MQVPYSPQPGSQTAVTEGTHVGLGDMVPRAPDNTLQALVLAGVPTEKAWGQLTPPWQQQLRPGRWQGEASPEAEQALAITGGTGHWPSTMLTGSQQSAPVRF